MSHPGNDEIIDNERDNQTRTLDPKRYALIDEMVHHATKMGIGVVQEIAEETAIKEAEKHTLLSSMKAKYEATNVALKESIENLFLLC